ncbi:MAG TPA: ribosomal protein S18-alanine N-acetyltransferase [Longimicrobiaceae bacterium]|nr:ribosomal protein S18-alanine N-acetyltransferase [Longimicrobiaceae bacterium]
MSSASEEVGTSLHVRPLSFGDLPAVMAIEREAFSTPWREVTFEGLLARPDADVLGAMRMGQLVGYSVCWTVGDQSELGNVAVHESERRRGTGQRLVDEALARVRERGSREIFLEVRESNRAARALYEKCGFQLIGRRRHYYTKPVEDALVMRLDLV